MYYSRGMLESHVPCSRNSYILAQTSSAHPRQVIEALSTILHRITDNTDESLPKHNGTTFGSMDASAQSQAGLIHAKERLIDLFVTRKDIESLPPEVLSHIFLLGVVDERHNPETVNGKSSGRFMALVSRVHHRWRKIAIGTPMLWQHIVVTGPGDIRRIRLHIERSKTCPLDVDVLGSRNSIFALDILFLVVERWRDVIIEGNDHVLFHHFFRNFTRPAPLLERLSVKSPVSHFINPDHLPHKRDLVSFRHVAPRLRYLDVEGMAIKWKGHTFQHLTSLRIAVYNSKLHTVEIEVYRLLESTSNTLEFLELYHTPLAFLSPPDSTLANFPPLSFPHLKHLAYGNVLSNPDFEWFIHQSHMPSLETLALLDGHLPNMDLTMVQSCATSPLLKKVTNLCLSNVILPPEMVEPFLQAMPAVTQLEIYGRYSVVESDFTVLSNLKIAKLDDTGLAMTMARQFLDANRPLHLLLLAAARDIDRADLWALTIDVAVLGFFEPGDERYTIEYDDTWVPEQDDDDDESSEGGSVSEDEDGDSSGDDDDGFHYTTDSVANESDEGDDDSIDDGGWPLDHGIFGEMNMLTEDLLDGSDGSDDELAM